MPAWDRPRPFWVSRALTAGLLPAPHSDGGRDDVRGCEHPGTMQSLEGSSSSTSDVRDPHRKPLSSASTTRPCFWGSLPSGGVPWGMHERPREASGRWPPRGRVFPAPRALPQGTLCTYGFWFLLGHAASSGEVTAPPRRTAGFSLPGPSLPAWLPVTPAPSSLLPSACPLGDVLGVARADRPLDRKAQVRVRAPTRTTLLRGAVPLPPA